MLEHKNNWIAVLPQKESGYFSLREIHPELNKLMRGTENLDPLRNSTKAK